MTWQSSSLLLAHPAEALLNQLALVHRASHLLPDDVGGPLRAAVLHLEGASLAQLQKEYVETFDAGRRHSLFLACSHDALERGEALQRFEETYQRAGHLIADTERADHLCVVLDFAATVDQTLGQSLLLRHRSQLELLRMSLQEVESGWTGAVTAVIATLPAPDAHDVNRLLKLSH